MLSFPYIHKFNAVSKSQKDNLGDLTNSSKFIQNDNEKNQNILKQMNSGKPGYQILKIEVKAQCTQIGTGLAHPSG